MIEELWVAFVVGLSLSNVGVCILVAMGCTARDRKAGGYFILGRAIGIVLIGLLFIALGSLIQGYTFHIIIIFAAISITLGVVMLYEAVSGNRLDMLERLTFVAGGKRRGLKAVSCEGNEKEGTKLHPRDGSGPRGRGTGKGCGIKGSPSSVMSMKSGRMRRREFFILGLTRGATPCLKLIVLVPLLVVSGIALSLGMLLVFAISSSLYPLIGFLGMSLLDGVESYARPLKIIGALMIIILGIYVPANYMVNHSVAIPGG